MSINITTIVENYLCPCQNHYNEFNDDISVIEKKRFSKCTQCSFPWPIFHPNPLVKCLSCKSHFQEIVDVTESTSFLECFFCRGQIPQIVIIDHFQKIVSLHLSKIPDTPEMKSNNPQCQQHNWSFRFLEGQFLKHCDVCGIQLVIDDYHEILSHSSNFLNCCNLPRTRFSAFKYLDFIILQCLKCLSKTVVTQTETFEKWLSSGNWGVGFSEEQILSIDDIHIGDHFVYIRQFYEHHVIIVWINSAKGRYKEIGFNRPFKNSKFDSKLTMGGKIHISDVTFKKIEDPMVVINYLPLDCYHAGHVVRRAFSRIKESDYNLLTKNCEHMATWCKYGVYECIQVKRLFEKYAKIGQDLITANVIPNVKLVCDKINKVKEDPTVAQIQNAVIQQQEIVKDKLLDTLNYICGEKKMTKEEEPPKR